MYSFESDPDDLLTDGVVPTQEFRKQNMELAYRLDESYEDFDIAWVQADLARISQVLVNLVIPTTGQEPKAGCIQ